MAAFGHIRKGAFHRWLGKKEGEPITDADIAKGIAAGGHAAKMAEFAKSSRAGKFKHKKGPKRKRGDGEHAQRMYGEGSKSKKETSSEAKHMARQHIRQVHP